jgi:ribosomal protein L33
MAKKTARIKVGLVCTETGVQNYVTEINKLRPEILKTEVMKYSPLLRRRSKHKFTKKLD